PVPAEADLVIIQENIDRDGDVATVARPYGPGRHIRKAGSDFRAGDVLLPKGHRLTWKSLTTAAAADHAQVEVYRAPRVAILATGDELASPGEAHLKPGSIPESVSLAIGALVREHGADLIRSQRFPDEPDQLGAAAKAALEEADLVIAIGGASVGERDYSRDMFGRSLDFIFPKVAMKPGKPVWMAKAGARFIVGLPGNPTSALVTARLLLVPLLEGLSGASAQAALQFRREMCRDALPQCGGREAFLRAIRTPDGLVLANSQESSSQQVLALADVLIRRAAHAEATEPGAMVEIVDF
ncbi:MAG: molybdopterin molybdotransferase MoeA, partial [Alphaproteobacteria bacterium]|nr:molybdopterin molybdotransferase MoeA [Alphaproteobacteria bacterium]